MYIVAILDGIDSNFHPIFPTTGTDPSIFDDFRQMIKETVKEIKRAGTTYFTGLCRFFEPAELPEEGYYLISLNFYSSDSKGVC